MCAMLICSMVLCLLGAGSLDAKVTQTPGHLLKRKGQNAKMYCVPKSGHNYVFWYQQTLEKEFKFLVSLQYKKVLKREVPKERFLAECPQDSPCWLEIQGVELQESAVYLCASRDTTVLNISQPQCTNCLGPAQEAGGTLGWKERKVN